MTAIPQPKSKPFSWASPSDSLPLPPYTPFFSTQNHSNEHPTEPLDFHDMYERTDRRPLSLRPPPPNHRQALEPPQLPFAKDERPLSHGSDNTFGAIRQNSLLLGDSDSSLMTDPRRNSQPLVDSANNSNHTLGTFCPKPSLDYYII
ncbi:hypothetical protein G6F56_012330 [Rhizopus delemar]|nr:hypothetical protein G6F56_012330 [Rhizopus delemar]